MTTLEQRGSLSLQVVQPDKSSSQVVEMRGFQEGTIGIYAPGALGVAMAHNLGTNQFITRAGSRSAGMFAPEADLHLVTGEGQIQTESILHGRFSVGIVEKYRLRVLPEVVIACSNADRVPDLVKELVDLTYAYADDRVLHISRDGELRGTANLPAIILVSNGILDESLRERVREAMTRIVQDKSVGEALASSWLGKIVRGLSYVRAERTGFGPTATYTPPTAGVVTLTGGEKETRERITELTKDRGGIRFLDRGAETVEYEWRKAYTNLMTNVVGLALCFDQRKGTPRLNIPVGRILQRMKPTNSVTYVEVEGAKELCERLGKAFFIVAKKKGLFVDYGTWEEFNQKVFLDPIKDPQGFYRHIPSSLQMIANQVRVGRLPDGIPPNEGQIIFSLLSEIDKQDSSEIRETQEALLTIAKTIEENISAVKEIYRRPQAGEPKTGTIRRLFNQTGEVGYIAFHPENISLSPEQVQRYTTKASDVDSSGESVVPMTAEVFTYGPEQIPGNVAFITNGAGFTLEAMDRCVEAGVRLGFVSDLRLQFEEGKYYLAMKMALAANPAIDTIAVDVLTTLGTSSDVAGAVMSVASEHPGLKFVVKLEGREQDQGIEILQRLKRNGLQIIFTDSDETLSTGDMQPLTLDQMIRALRRLDGMQVDEVYANKYEALDTNTLGLMLKFALEQRFRQLLIPTAMRDDNRREIEFLSEQNMLRPDAVFGGEFKPARVNEALTGKPVVVIVGYGETPRLQAKLMRQAGTEVVLLHLQIHNKVRPVDLDALHSLGIKTYANAEELKTDFDGAYPEGVDLIGVCYEPYKLEVGNGVVYSERIEQAVISLIELKTTYSLSMTSILIPTEMVPTVGAKQILSRCKAAGIWFIGPNSPGMSRVNRQAFIESDGTHLKVAQIPRQCILVGDIVVAGVGGTMLFETLSELKREGQGITWAISLGGDRTRGLSARDAALIAENDPHTRYFVYIGEPGGFAAQELAEVMGAGLITKPVIVKLIGYRLPDHCYVGHAGAVTHGDDYEKTDVKIEKLRQAGAIIVNTPEQMTQVIKYIETYPRFGRIDTESIEFQTARTIMKNLANAQDTVIGGFVPRN